MNYKFKNSQLTKRTINIESVNLSFPISAYSGKNHKKDKFKISLGATRSAKYFFDVHPIFLNEDNNHKIILQIPKPTEKSKYFKVVQGKGTVVSAKIFAADWKSTIATKTYFLKGEYFVKELINSEHKDWASTKIYSITLKNKDVFSIYPKANWVNIYKNNLGEEIHALHFKKDNLEPFIKIKKHNENKLDDEVFESGNMDLNDIVDLLEGKFFDASELLKIYPDFFENFEIQSNFKDKTELESEIKND